MKKLNAFTVYMIYSGGMALLFNLIFTVNMVYQAVIVGLSPLQLVLVGTTLEVAAFIFEVPTGIVADVYSRRLSVIIGLVLVGIGFMFEGSLPFFWAVLVAQVIWGLGITFISGAGSAWLVDEIGEERAANAFLRSTQVEQVAGLVGIALSALLAALYFTQLPIILGGVLFVVLALVLIAIMPEQGFTRVPASDRETWSTMRGTLRDGVGLIRTRPVLMSLLLVELLYGAYSEGFDRLWTKFMLDSFELPGIGTLDPVVWFGVIGAVSMILSIISTEFVRRRVDLTQQKSATRTLMLLYAMVAVATIAFGLAKALPVALIAYWLVGIARTTSTPVFSAWINQHIDSNVRSTVLSLTNQTNALGQIAGGPAVGVVAQRYSIRAALTISGTLLLPSLGLLRRLPQAVEPAANSAES